MAQPSPSVNTLPLPPPDGSTLEVILLYLDSIRWWEPPPAHFSVVLNGYTFNIDYPLVPWPPPAVWYITSMSPSTARDTQIARPKLGYQWCWNYAIDTVAAEITRVLTAVPTPDPGPWPPPL